MQLSFIGIETNQSLCLYCFCAVVNHYALQLIIIIILFIEVCERNEINRILRLGL